MIAERSRPELGGVDILINNAGTMPKARQICKVTEDEWQYTMGVNLHAPWYLSNLARMQMKVWIWLSTVQANGWARDGIRVSCLAPGIVRTGLAHDVITYVEEHNEKPNPLNIIDGGEII